LVAKRWRNHEVSQPILDIIQFDLRMLVGVAELPQRQFQAAGEV
jgi:hypothetical protein